MEMKIEGEFRSVPLDFVVDVDANGVQVKTAMMATHGGNENDIDLFLIADLREELNAAALAAYIEQCERLPA